MYKTLEVFAKLPLDRESDLGVRAANTFEKYQRLCAKLDDSENIQTEKKELHQHLEINFSGHAWAQAYLGEMYESGFGIQPDAEKAKKYFKQAARGGIAWAMAKLTETYSEEVQKAGDPKRQKELGAIYPATIVGMNLDGTITVEFESIEDQTTKQTVVVSRKQLQRRYLSHERPLTR